MIWLALARASTWGEVLDDEPAPEPPASVELGAMLGFQGRARLPFQPGFSLGGEALFRLQHRATFVVGLRGERFITARSGILDPRSDLHYVGGYGGVRLGFLSKGSPFSAGVVFDVGLLAWDVVDRSITTANVLVRPAFGVAGRVQFARRPFYTAIEVGPAAWLYFESDLIMPAVHANAAVLVGVYL